MGALRYVSGKLVSKTIDIGRDGIAISADQLGTIHQLSAFHPKHGLVLAEPYPQFDGTRFHDSNYVREYRTRMLKSIRAGSPGFGFRFDVQVQNTKIEFEGLGSASISMQTAEGINLTTRLTTSENGELIQYCSLINNGGSQQSVRYYFDLGMSINRASYGQLTEGGPILLPKSSNELVLVDEGRSFVISNTHLGARLQGAVSEGCQVVDLRSKIQEGVYTDEPVDAEFSGELQLRSGVLHTLEARLCLKPISLTTSPSVLPPTLELSNLSLWNDTENQAQFIVRRNLEYILGNCAIPVPSASDAVCLITDHVALPLGWNRDNYWQARFLLDAHQCLPKIGVRETTHHYANLIKRTLKGHLTWVYRHAQRPRKYWHRSYLVTGRPKDGAVFQLDQQCYPLLLLCDFLQHFPEERAFVAELASSAVIPEILNLIGSKQDSSIGLFATEETPGDDAVEYPFHFSSQVLLWYTFSKVSALANSLQLQAQVDAIGLEQKAEALKAATMRHFLVRAGPEHLPMFAYLVGGDGPFKAYHDANDIPTLFSKAWRFVESKLELEVWQNTMRFGSSTANEGGYYDGGQFAGLGSIHTPGPWPLGYFQMWRFAQMTGDRKAEDQAWQKICGSMQWDGLFSEAVDVETGDCISKAWFCWPGAMIGSGLLQVGVRERYL